MSWPAECLCLLCVRAHFRLGQVRQLFDDVMTEKGRASIIDTLVAFHPQQALVHTFPNIGDAFLQYLEFQVNIFVFYHGVSNDFLGLEKMRCVLEFEPSNLHLLHGVDFCAVHAHPQKAEHQILTFRTGVQHDTYQLHASGKRPAYTP